MNLQVDEVYLMGGAVFRTDKVLGQMFYLV
jgi:hypothetical protein